ncbi:MAG: type III-B CRISPR-associated protein Cas10/Cmr2 [Thermoproteus sp.]
MDVRKFFELKLYALLHDPPNKMWALLGGKDHEQEAKSLYDRIFSGTVFGGGVPPDLKEVRTADRMAATAERFVFYKGGPSKYVVEYKRLHNIFDPVRSYEIPDLDERKYSEYVDKLKGLLGGVCAGDPRACYHAFYALYEGLWIAEGLPPSLADTRAPTHDVFDHLYAAAMLMNWLMWGDKPKGYLAVIDVPGVQQFVGAGRKAGDFWAGSWALSMTVWLTVWPLVWELGPDILLRPTARLNPYYYVFLHHKLETAGAKSANQMNVNQIAEVLMDAIYKFTGMRQLSDEGYLLRLPFIGESALLALPPERPGGGQWTAEQIRDELKERFREALECLKCLTAGATCGGACADLQRALGAESSASQLAMLASFRLPARVTVVDVEKAYDSIKCDKDLAEAVGGEEACKSLLFFDRLLTDELRRAAAEQSRRFVPTPGPWFEPNENDINDLRPLGPLAVKLPANAFQAAGGNWQLSSYDQEPAVLRARKTPGGDYNQEDLQALASAGLGQGALQRVVKAGEHLGPTLLAKRLLYLALSREKKPIAKFESTEDVAVYNLASNAADLFKSEACERVRQYLTKEPPRDATAIWQGANAVEAMRGDWARCVGNLLSESPADVVNALRGRYPEFFRYADAGGGARRVAEALLGPRLFYAIVRGDGDNVGKVLGGELGQRWYEEVEKVVGELLPNVKGDLEEAKRDIEGALRVLEALRKTLGGRVPVTPALRMAVTRAMMASSLKDAATADALGGTLIYAGGDDVLALYPVEKALEAAARHRENYWGEEGFHKAGSYAVPALAAYGRSFAVHFVHIMDIMADEFAASYHSLEHMAKEAKWPAFEKDSIAITSSRTDAAAVLPFRKPREVTELLTELWAMTLAGALSGNFPYDLERSRADEVKDAEAYRRLYLHILDRNLARKELAPAARLEELLNKYGIGVLKGVAEALKILRRLP